MRVINKIFRIILLLFAMGMIFVPAKSDPSELTHWSEALSGMLLNIFMVCIALDSLLVIAGFSKRKFQIYLELILYPLFMIGHSVVIIVHRHVIIDSLVNPQLETLDIRYSLALFAIFYLLELFVLFAITFDAWTKLKIINTTSPQGEN